MPTHGIHHITAIAGNPQSNIDFYVGTLGMRLVKKTVNFDDPHRYHFYYGDGVGRPGTILTFFAWGDSSARKGRRGTGQVTTISLSVPETSLEFWKRRLEEKDVHVDGPFDRFGEEFVRFRDPDGLELELVAASDSRSGWESESAPPGEAIRGLHSLSLSVAGEGTERLITGMLGFRKVADEGDRCRYESGEGGPGNMVDVLRRPGSPAGRMGVGVNHHVAWRITDGETQAELRGRLLDSGSKVSEVMDRSYFRSIYFNEPGGVLFEVATDSPGIDIDEDVEHLGSSLKLPARLEPRREEIEMVLPPVVIPRTDG